MAQQAAKQDFAAMNSDLKEFGNHLNLVKKKPVKHHATAAHQHNIVSMTSKRSPKAIANISRVNLNYQKYEHKNPANQNLQKVAPSASTNPEKTSSLEPPPAVL